MQKCCSRQWDCPWLVWFVRWTDFLLFSSFLWREFPDDDVWVVLYVLHRCCETLFHKPHTKLSSVFTQWYNTAKWKCSHSRRRLFKRHGCRSSTGTNRASHNSTTGQDSSERWVLDWKWLPLHLHFDVTAWRRPLKLLLQPISCIQRQGHTTHNVCKQIHTALQKAPRHRRWETWSRRLVNNNMHMHTQTQTCKCSGKWHTGFKPQRASSAAWNTAGKCR